MFHKVAVTRMKECYLITQDNTIYKFSIKISFSCIGQNKTKLQKQIRKLLHLNCNGSLVKIIETNHFLYLRNKEMFYLTTHSTHFIYGYMVSHIWLRTILIMNKETRCRHIGYSFRLTARVLLYTSSHRQDSTYHGLCYTSRGALAGTIYLRNIFLSKICILYCIVSLNNILFNLSIFFRTLAALLVSDLCYGKDIRVVSIILCHPSRLFLIRLLN